MDIQLFIKWSGSKRSQAKEIVSYFPKEIKTYFEPFLGSGAVLGCLRPKVVMAGDINEPLIEIWNMLKNDPTKVIEDYKRNWFNLQKNGYLYYYQVRGRFNKLKHPLDLLFLTRTCVNGLIRYNKNGDFNNSLHHTRRGIHPNRLKKILLDWSFLIKDYDFYCQRYEATTKSATSEDFIYLDPPYFNTGTRYFGNIDYEEFIEYLFRLNKKNVRFALSYDGKRGNKSYMVEIPKHLYKRHILLHSGNSTFGKVQNNKLEQVFESLYLNY